MIPEGKRQLWINNGSRGWDILDGNYLRAVIFLNSGALGGGGQLMLLAASYQTRTWVKWFLLVVRRLYDMPPLSTH